MELKLLNQLITSAKEVYPTSPILQQVAVTQAIHESNFLGKAGGSKLALKYNNLFGIKGEGTHRPESYIELKTWEHIKGRDIVVMAKFEWNATWIDSFKRHSRVLALKRYELVRLSRSLPEAFKALVKGGYATDPKYSSNLEIIWKRYVATSFR